MRNVKDENLQSYLQSVTQLIALGADDFAGGKIDDAEALLAEAMELLSDCYRFVEECGIIRPAKE